MKSLFSRPALVIMAALHLGNAACALPGGSLGGADPDTEIGTAEQASELLLRMPAEWEPHESVWMAWPTYESMQGRPKEPLYMEIVEALAPHVDIDMIVATEADAEYVAGLLDEHGVPRQHVRFRVIPSVMDIWVRDTGPIFVKNAWGQVPAVDFRFNSWGYEGYSSLYPWDSDTLDAEIAALLGKPTITSTMISEGGAIDTNGEGTMLITEAVAFQRNPDMTRAEIEAVYKKKLGMSKVIWIERGVPEDDLSFWRGRGVPDDVYTVLTVGGHVDEFVRFVDEDTVLLAEVTEAEAAEDPVSQEARIRLEETYATLSNATNQAGQPLEIIRVPGATPIYETMGPGDSTYEYIASLAFEDGSTFPEGSPITTISAASYLNFFITNGVVLMPTYWKPGRPESVAQKDAQMMQALQDAFPTRQIVGINPEAINVGGGGIHCITQQQPLADAP